MRVVLILIMSLAVYQSTAQDKKAKKVLDKLSEVYNQSTSLDITFDLTIDYPDQEAVTYPSSVVQSGEKWVFKNSEQELYNNGEDIWVYIPVQNEVQINDYDEEETEEFFVSPIGLLSQYDSGKFEYQIVAKDGQVTEIEFKPMDEFSDYSKFRISVDQKLNKLNTIIAFGKDGSKATILIKSIIKDIVFEASTFQFDAKKYPGVRIEDLRLD